jgi:hypothetical protein
LEQEIELAQRDRLQLMERIESLETVLERVINILPNQQQQQQLFESKIQLLKDRVKNYKLETAQVKTLLEAEHNRTEQRKEDVIII